VKHLIILISIFYAVSNISLFSQIVNAEYFIDADPGIGKATKIGLVDLNNLNFNINKNQFSDGFHLIGVRIKNISGNWSSNSYYNLYIQKNIIDANKSSLNIEIGDSVKKYYLSDENIESNTWIEVLLPKNQFSEGFNNIKFTYYNKYISLFHTNIMHYFQKERNINPKSILLSVLPKNETVDLKGFNTFLLTSDSIDQYSFFLPHPKFDSAEFIFNAFLIDTNNLLGHYTSKKIFIDKYLKNAVEYNKSNLTISDDLIILNDESIAENIDIISINGKSELKFVAIQNNIIDVSKLPSGIYFLLIENRNSKFYYKFIKM